MKHLCLLSTIFALSAVGCSKGYERLPLSEDPFPMRVGSYWLYNEINSATSLTIGSVNKEVIGEEEFAGVNTFVLNTTESDPTLADKRSNWFDDNRRLERLRQRRLMQGTLLTERTWEPGFLRIDRGHIALGDSLRESSTRKEFDSFGNLMASVVTDYSWLVEDSDVSVTVPAGTFTTVQIMRTNNSSGEVKRYWYAFGVGKVLEEGPFEREELVEYAIGP